MSAFWRVAYAVRANSALMRNIWTTSDVQCTEMNKELSRKQRDELLAVLKARFERNLAGTKVWIGPRSRSESPILVKFPTKLRFSASARMLSTPIIRLKAPTSRLGTPIVRLISPASWLGSPIIRLIAPRLKLLTAFSRQIINLLCARRKQAR